MENVVIVSFSAVAMLGFLVLIAHLQESNQEKNKKK